jgi:hypothetical protein
VDLGALAPHSRLFLPLLSRSAKWVLTYDLKGVGDNADSHELLSVVAAVHHERVGETLNDGALGLPESLDGISAGRVRCVDRRADLDVVAGASVSRWTSQQSYLPFPGCQSIHMQVCGYSIRCARGRTGMRFM